MNLKTFAHSWKGLPITIKDYYKIKSQLKKLGLNTKISFNTPFFADRYMQSGNVSTHYFYQDNLVASAIYNRNPKKHVDIGSRIDGFVSMVSIFRPIEVFDIRPLNIKINNITFKQEDIGSDNFNLSNYCDSVSCLHALEHFGLGRYGDKIDVFSLEKGLSNLIKLLANDGFMYLSLPIGEERIDFNAHRVLNISTILNLIGDRMKLVGFSFIDDDGTLHKNVDLNIERIKSNCGCNFGCGIFELRKKI